MPFLSKNITYLGKTTHRNDGRLFGIKNQDRFAHLFMIGKTGTGKTTLLQSMIKQDIEANRGVCVFDPHGDLAEEAVGFVPSSRANDLIHINLSEKQNQYFFNPLKKVSDEYKSLVCSSILDVLKHQWSDGKSWGVNMEHLLRNIILTLLDQKQANLADIPKLLTSESFRRVCLKEVSNKQVKDFWQDQWKNLSPYTKASFCAPVLNKVGAFLSNPKASSFVLPSKDKKPLSIRQSMDEGKILVINLSKGSIGSDASSLIGGLLLSMIILSAISRAVIPEEKRKPFFTYVDECASFANLTLASGLSEIRKYKTGLILACQYTAQLNEKIFDAIVGNCGSLICFRIGAKDAALMEKEFSPDFSKHDLVNLKNYNMAIKLLIDGQVSKAFSGETVFDLNLRV